MMWGVRRFRDPLYGMTEVDSFEYSLLTAPEVQRLRYIRMCNINSLLITGASEISRFEHTVGVLRLVKEWVAFHPQLVTSADAKLLAAAAVLHDVQTGPFGHSLQYVLEDNRVEGNFRHEDPAHGIARSYYQDLEVGASFAGQPFSSKTMLSHEWDAVAAMIRGEGRLGPLIAGIMDLDNIDNVIRLAYHSGAACSDDGKVPLTLARSILPSADGISLPSSAISQVQKWQEIRRKLYELLLLDWAEFSAKGMLTAAMEQAVVANLIGADRWLLTDDELLSYLEASRGESQDISELVRRLRCGDLYQPVVLWRTRSITPYRNISHFDVKRDLEAKIAKLAREKLGASRRFIFHCILDKAKTERAVTVRVLETGENRTVGMSSSALLIGIFASRPLTANEGFCRSLRTLLAEYALGELEDIRDPVVSQDADLNANARTCAQLSLL